MTAEGPDLSITIPADAYETKFKMNIKGFFGQVCWIETTNRVEITTSTSKLDAESEDISPNLPLVKFIYQRYCILAYLCLPKYMITKVISYCTRN